MEQISPETFKLRTPGRWGKETILHAKDTKQVGADSEAEEEEVEGEEESGQQMDNEMEAEQEQEPDSKSEMEPKMAPRQIMKRLRTRQLAGTGSGILAQALREPMSFTWTCEKLMKALKEARKSGKNLLWLPEVDTGQGPDQQLIQGEQGQQIRE